MLRSNTWLTTESFRARQLPAVCVATGEPATNWISKSVKSRIGPQWLLLLLGIFPLVLVRVLTIKRAIGYLPINPDAIAKLQNELRSQRKFRRRKILRNAVILTLVTFLVAGVIGSFRLLAAKHNFDRDENQFSLQEYQEDWDAAAAMMPLKSTEMRGGTEDPSLWYDSWTLNSDGCVRSEAGFDPEDPEITVICRPENRTDFESELNGYGFDLMGGYFIWGGDSRLIPMIGVDEQNIYEFSEYVNTAELNLAYPLSFAAKTVPVAFILAVIGSILIGYFGVKSLKPVPRNIFPRLWLDRSGERLVVAKAHYLFVSGVEDARLLAFGPSVGNFPPVSVNAEPQVIVQNQISSTPEFTRQPSSSTSTDPWWQ